MTLSHQLDKLGIVGSILTSCLCLGVPAIASAIGALGLGFLANDAILAPLLVVFLGLSIGGLAPGWRRHRSPWPLTIAIAGAVGLLIVTFTVHAHVLSYVAIGVLVAASITNAVFLRRRRTGSSRRPLAHA